MKVKAWRDLCRHKQPGPAALASLRWPASPWPSGPAALATRAASSSPSYLITSFLSSCHHVRLIALVFMAEETEATQASNLPKVTQQGTMEPGLPVGFWPRACTFYHRAVPAGGCVRPWVRQASVLKDRTLCLLGAQNGHR